MKKEVNIKRTVIMALLPLMMAGCIRHDMEDPDNEIINGASQRITVTASIIDDITDDAVVTRGTPVNKETDMVDFGFFCSYTGTGTWNSATGVPDKMFNKKMVRVNGFWDYSDTPVMWDNTSAADNYTFFAYSPFATVANGITVTSSANTVGVPVLNYTVQSAVQHQPDLMIAIPRENIHPTGHPVSLQMKHALTAVGFMVYGSGTITGISITGIHTNGNLSMDGNNIVWDIPLGSVSAIDFASSISGGSYTVDSDTPENPLTADGYLMMIPQTLTNDAKVKITANGVTKEVDLIDAIPQWEAGKRVIYSIDISPK